MIITDKTVFQLSKEVLAQEISGESILLDMKSEQYFGLNNVGNDVLNLLKEKNNLETILKSLLQKYDVDTQQLKSDITELLQELLDTQLISIVN